jgi:hypothetical protein
LRSLVDAFVFVLFNLAPSLFQPCQEVRLDLEKVLRSDAHQLASHLLGDALARHTWSIHQQLAAIDNAECPAAARGSDECVHAAFQSAMLQHMDSCFGFNLGSKPAPSISVRSLSVGSVSSETAVHMSRAFISGCVCKRRSAQQHCARGQNIYFNITHLAALLTAQYDYRAGKGIKMDPLVLDFEFAEPTVTQDSDLPRQRCDFEECDCCVQRDQLGNIREKCDCRFFPRARHRSRELD